MSFNQNPQYGYNQGSFGYGEDLKVIAYRHLTNALIIASIVVIGLNLLFPDPANPTLVILYGIGSIVEIGIIFVLFFAALFRKQFSESTALTMLNVFAVASSITLGYMVNVITNYFYNGTFIVALTFGIATVTVFGIYAYTSANKPDVSGMARYVMFGAIIFIVVAILGMFMFSDNPLFYLVISGAGALLFALFMYMDFARLERRQFSSPAMMALMLFYDIIYFIKYLLEFLVMIMGDRR